MDGDPLSPDPVTGVTAGSPAMRVHPGSTPGQARVYRVSGHRRQCAYSPGYTRPGDEGMLMTGHLRREIVNVAA